MDNQNLLGKLLKDDSTSYIGWDVGGMHGANNALCVLENDRTQGLKETTKPIAKHTSPEQLAQSIAAFILSHKKETTLLAIDAPLSFPRAFVSQIRDLTKVESIPFEKQINNPLAYRECESHLHTVTGKRPLSASFDQLTSLVFLVLRVFHLLNERDDVNLIRLPYDSVQVRKGLNAFECYPALLKPTKKSLKSDPEKKAKFDQFVANSHLQLRESHQLDAQYCALFAVYEHLVAPSPFSTHECYKGDLKEEGWIYGPY